MSSQDKKEEAIKQILTAKKEDKKKASTPAKKKLKPAKKVAKKSAKKGKGKAKAKAKAKAKGKGKSKAKPKLKAKKKVKKPSNVKKAAKKVGGKLKPKKKANKKTAGKKKNAGSKNNKKKKGYSLTFSRDFLEKYRSMSSLSQKSVTQTSKPQPSQSKTIVETIVKEKVQQQPEKVTTQPQKPKEFGFHMGDEETKSGVSDEFIDNLFIKQKGVSKTTQDKDNSFLFSEGDNSEEIQKIRGAEGQDFSTIVEQFIREQLKKKQQTSSNFEPLPTQDSQPETTQNGEQQPSQPQKSPQDEQFFH